jgi:hypothetical protein
MNLDSPNLVIVFPISASAFGLRGDWFNTILPKLTHPAYLLAVLLLVASIGIMALKRFENAEFEKKFWNLPVLLAIITFWPALVLGLKELVDTFNTFLVVDIFRMRWEGFGFPSVATMSSFVTWPAEGLARLLPNLAYWIVYAFYLMFFFFYAVLGPLVLAKGVLFDEMENFLELVKELMMLFLWQTTVIIMVAFIMPDIVSGDPFPAVPPANFYFLSVILGLMIFFVPTVTRKFGSHLEGSFVPLGLRWGGGMLGISAFGKAAAPLVGAAGVPVESSDQVTQWTKRASKIDDFKSRYEQRRYSRDLEDAKKSLQERLSDEHEQDQMASKEISQLSEGSLGIDEREEKEKKKPLFELFKKAKRDLEEEENE